MTDSRFSAVNPYSSWVHSTGPEGSLPSLGKKPWIVPDRDSNVGQDAHNAWVLVASGPTPFYFLTLKVPRAIVEPVDGPTFELLGLDGL